MTKKEKKDNLDLPYFMGYEDGYEAGLEENMVDSTRGEGCDWCKELEAGDFVYDLVQDECDLSFQGTKAWFCPVCGAPLKKGPKEEVI